MSENEPKTTQGMSRREFVTVVGGAGAGVVLGGLLTKAFLLPDKVLAFPASEGYLLVDTKKCAGCSSCMLACSLVHSGENNLSTSRIQVTSNPFTAFPGGAEQNQCRQCPFPACVEACPTGANHIDLDNGNVRRIDPELCLGCERCIAACPFEISRAQWDPEGRSSQKCDLCTDAPFWSEEGGIGGKQACVEVCPVHAITFTKEVPVQSGNEGYQVNLRKDSGTWKIFGLPDGDDGEFTVPPGQAAFTGG